MATKKKQSTTTGTTDISPTESKYGVLAQELDQILQGIEEGEIDIDDLSTKVERATGLIKMCREKLNATQIRVQKVVASLEDEDEVGFGDDDDDDDDEEKEAVWEDDEEEEEDEEEEA